MNADVSESFFREYLRNNDLVFAENAVVGRGNVDFRVEKSGVVVLCDVKEIKSCATDGVITTDKNIREDIKKLRRKFSHPPDRPVVSVSVNFSASLITGLTIARALLGAIGVFFDRKSTDLLGPIHHLHHGNAALTGTKNTSISGVLMLDVSNGSHCLFRSPYACHAVPEDFFPVARVVNLSHADGQGSLELNKLVFWPRHQ